MPGLRIGAPALPAKDIAYIRSLVRLFAYTDKVRWSFVDHAPYTAVVTDPAASTAGGGAEALLLTMLDGGQGSEKIAYPIRADQFRDWLRRMADAETVQAEPTAAPLSAMDDYNQRYKLRRWPSVLHLGGDPLRMRMASLMSRTPLSTTELVGITNASLDACAGFVDALHLAGLLIPMGRTPAPEKTSAALPGDAPAQRAGHQGGFTASLLNNIRRRIGLQERVR